MRAVAALIRRWSVFCVAALGFLLPVTPAASQTAPATGTVSGLVLDTWNNRGLPGVVVVVRGTTLATTTDLNGNYTLHQVPPGEQTLSFSKSGYARAVVTQVKVAPGQTTKVDNQLRPEFYEMETYEVTAAELANQMEQILNTRQSAAALTDAIGALQFSRTGANDAADIVGRLPGITVTEGKNPVVRGLNERYTGILLNGAEVPSADPYRKSAQLDLFPAPLIDQVIVQKNFTPDQPGSFTGGGINIVTRSFPEKPFLGLSLGGSYNTQATDNELFLTYQGGGLDWAAMDDGTRALAGPLAGDTVNIPFPPFNSGRANSANYEKLVADADRLQSLTRALGATQFAPTPDAPPLNHNFSVQGGRTSQVFGKPFGYFAGLSYRRDFSFYEDGISRRYAPANPPGTFLVRKDFSDTRGTEEVNWAGVVNLAYKLHEDHDVGFNFLYNQNSENVARRQVGTTTDDPNAVFYLNRLHFTERNLHTFQLKGSDRFSALADLKLDWLGAFSETSQDEPDTRFFNFVDENGTLEVGKASVPSPREPTRSFRNLDEDNRNLKFDLTQPFDKWGWDGASFKTGLFDSQSARDFRDREFYYQGNAGFNGDPNSYLNDANLGYTATTNASTGRITYNWSRYIQSRESAYHADSGVQAGYLMLDAPIPRVQVVRLIGGVRLESTDLSVNSRSYLPNSLTGLSTNTSELNQTDLLPSAGLVYAIRTNMNLRLSYSQTIARPSFRELAAYRSFDPVLDELLDGNPTLKMSSINNYDARWEWFPKPGEVLAVSLFYKELENAIERRFVTIDGEIITFVNRPKGKVYGLELEGRKHLGFIDPLLSDFSLGGNVALIQSEVDLTPEELSARATRVPGTKSTRPLFDQSPYIINADISYDNDRTGTAATLAFSVYGPRITIASLNTEDIYEQPAPSLDFIISQRVWRDLTVKFSVRNLLNPRVERSYGEEGKLLYSSFQRGLTFGLSLNYDF